MHLAIVGDAGDADAAVRVVDGEAGAGSELRVGLVELVAVAEEFVDAVDVGAELEAGRAPAGCDAAVDDEAGADDEDEEQPESTDAAAVGGLSGEAVAWSNPHSARRRCRRQRGAWATSGRTSSMRGWQRCGRSAREKDGADDDEHQRAKDGAAAHGAHMGAVELGALAHGLALHAGLVTHDAALLFPVWTVGLLRRIGRGIAGHVRSPHPCVWW